MVLLFAALLLFGLTTVAAATVVAPKDDPVPADFEGAPPPEDRIEEEREEIADREAERETSSAEEERSESREAYRDLSKSEAIDVLEAEHEDVITSPSWRPLQLPEGYAVAEFLSPNAARIDAGPDKPGAILESSYPLRAKTASGELAPVDTTIEEETGGFAAANPLVTVWIPENLEEGLRLPDIGLTLTPKKEEKFDKGAPDGDPSEEQVTPSEGSDADGSTSGGDDETEDSMSRDHDETTSGDNDGTEPVSDRQTAEGEPVQGKPFFANSDVDTDFFVQAIPEGLEVFWQLRSEDSPERLRLKVDLPDGAELRQSVGGTAEVVDGDDILARISAPVARDADGVPVPVSQAVQGGQLVLSIDHRKGDWAYPLLVDPAIREDFQKWKTNPNLDFIGWKTASNRPLWGTTSPDQGFKLKADDGQHGRGLYVVNPESQRFNNGDYGEWVYFAPGTTYIYRFELDAQSWDPPDNNNGDACAFHGIWSVQNQTWEPGNRATWEQCSSFGGDIHTVCTHPVPNPDQDACRADPGDQGTPGNLAAWGVTTRDGRNYGQFDLYASGAVVHYADADKPTNPTVTHTGLPVGWTDNATLRVNPSASDTGFGMKYFNLYRLKPDGALEYLKQAVHPCNGNRLYRCPATWSTDPNYRSWTTAIDYETATLPEGNNTLNLHAFDAVVNQSASPASWPVRVDRSAPTATLAGSLYEGRNAFLAADSYQLTVAAQDGTTGQPRSGVRRVQYRIKRGETIVRQAHQDNPACQPSGCPAQYSPQFTVNTDGLSDGVYRIEVLVGDQLAGDNLATAPVNHRFTTSFEVLIDRDAPSITSLSHDSNLATWRRDGAAITSTVAASDEGTGIKSFHLRLPGGPAAPTTNPCQGSPADRCPLTDSKALTYQVNAQTFPYNEGPDGSYSGDGPKDVSATVKDAAGHESAERKWQVRVDRQGPTVRTYGGLVGLNPTGRTLHVRAEDGVKFVMPRAGVTKLEFFIDRNRDGAYAAEERVAAKEQTCDDSCQLGLDYTLPPDYADGTYRAKVVATDGAGNETVKNWQFYALNLLPTSRSRLGLEDFFDYDSTEAGGDSRVHVNAETGNLVWHSVPIVNPGRGLSTFVNLTYNSHDRGGLLGSQLGRIPLVDLSDQDLSQELPGLSYGEAGQGFSIAVSGPTRINEPLGGVELAELKTEFLAAGHVPGGFGGFLSRPDKLNLPVEQIQAALPTDSSTPAGDTISLTDSDGTVHQFQRQANGTWRHPDGVNLYLRRYRNPTNGQPASRTNIVEDYWAITRPDGVTHFFDNLGYLRETKDRNGNSLRYQYRRHDVVRDRPCGNDLPIAKFIPTTEYFCTLQLIKVIDPANRELRIEYRPGGLLDQDSDAKLENPPLDPPIPVPGLIGGRAGRIAKITDHKNREYTFTYDEDGYLETFTEAANQSPPRATRLIYEPKDSGPDGQSGNEDDGFGQDRQLTDVVELRDGAEYARTRIDHELRDPNPPAPGVSRTVRKAKTLTDRLERTKDYAYDPQGNPNPPPPTRTFTVTAQRATSETPGGTPETTETVHKVDDRGRPIELTDDLGQRTQLVWDLDHRVTKLTVAAGSPDEAVSDLEYNQNGLLTKRTTHPTAGQSRVTELTYQDSGGVYHSNVDGVQEDTNFVSDLTALRKPKPDTGWTFTVDERGNTTDRTDAKGRSAHTDFDQFGQVVLERDEVGNVTRYQEFHPTGNPKVVIDPKGNVAGASASAHRWVYRYDEVGNVLAVTDPRGAATGGVDDARTAFTTTLSYDPFDRVLTEKRPKDSLAGQFITRSYTYDRNGNVTGMTDGRGLPTTVEYSKMDRPLSVATPGSNGAETTTYAYDGRDRLIRRTDPQGQSESGRYITEYRLDGIGQRLAEVRRSAGDTPSQLITSVVYDARGNVTGMVDPRRNAGKAVEQAISDAADPAKRRYTYAYNDEDERVSQIDRPASGDEDRTPLRTEYDYDANGNQVAVRHPRHFAAQSPDPEAVVTALTYDHRDQLIEQRDPLGHRTVLKRRFDGKVIAQTTPRGVAKGDTEPVDQAGADGEVYKYFTTRFDYDPAGEVTSRSIPFAPDQYGFSDGDLKKWKVTYTRDEVGDPKTIVMPRGNAAGTSDAIARFRVENTFYDTGDLKTTNRPGFYDLQRQGEGSPRLQERSVRTRNAEESDEDPELPQTGIEGNFGEADPEELPDLLPQAGRTEFTYDPDMRLTAISDVAGKVRRLEYDDAGRLRRMEWPFKDGEPIAHRMRYDANGNLTDFFDGEGTDADHTTFKYDGYNRRIRQTAPGAGGLPTGSASEQVTRLTYDPNGNLTSRETPRGTGTAAGGDFTETATYDSLDRLIEQENAAKERTRFWYDAAGNRVKTRSPRGNLSAMPDGEQRDWYDTRLEYDAADRVRKSIDGFGQETIYDYDADDQRSLIDAPGAEDLQGNYERRRTETTYDGRGLLWKEKRGTGDGRTTIRSYDPNGNLRRIVNPRGASDHANADNGTDSDANIKDATKHATLRLYNDDDLLTDVFLPWSTDSEDTLNGQGAEDQRYTQKFHRDSRGRADWVEIAHRIGASGVYRNNYCYFDTGWIRASSDQQQTIASGCPTQITYDYDKRGNQTLWKTKYDSATFGREIKRDFWPNGALRSRSGSRVEGNGAKTGTHTYGYGYNANGSLIAVTDDRRSPTTSNDDRNIAITRDRAERETVVDETWSSGKDTLLDHDANGNVTLRVTDGAHRNGDLVDEDGNGRQDVKRTEFRYDRLDRERFMEVTQGGEEKRTTEKRYFDSGDLKSKLSPNKVTETRFYNRFGELDRMRRQREGGTDFLKDQAYDHDQNGNRTRDERGTHQFNSRNQLVRWTRSKKKPGTRVTYQLNPTGGVTRETDTAYTGAAQVTTYIYAGAQLRRADNPDVQSDYSYDSFGNVTKIRHSAKHAGVVVNPNQQDTDSRMPAGCQQHDIDNNDTRYCYDEFERMRAARGVGASPEPTSTVNTVNSDPEVGHFEYDAFDRRERKIAIQPDNSRQTKDYSYIGTSRLLSREGSGSDVKSYDYDSNGERQGQGVASSSEYRYRTYGTDANGSVEHLMEYRKSTANDAQTNNGVKTAGTDYDYNPYGDYDRAGASRTDQKADPEKQLSGDGRENPFRYQGHYYESGVKTSDMGARQYRPESGRFLTPDRFSSARGDFNLQADPLTQDRYVFGGANPVNNIEFDGHEPSGSYTNGCDNTYGSDSRCRQESPARQAASRRNQRNYSYTYSNNWRVGRQTSPQQDAQQADRHATRTINTIPKDTPSRRYAESQDRRQERLRAHQALQRSLRDDANFRGGIFNALQPGDESKGEASSFAPDPNSSQAEQGETAASLLPGPGGKGRAAGSVIGFFQRVFRAGGNRAAKAGDDLPKVVNWGQQEKHFLGHSRFELGRSELTADPRKLVPRAGSGDPVGRVPRGQPGFRERIDFDEVIGTWVDDAGNQMPTTRGILHYGKRGIHIVPSRPR